MNVLTKSFSFLVNTKIYSRIGDQTEMTNTFIPVAPYLQSFPGLHCDNFPNTSERKSTEKRFFLFIWWLFSTWRIILFFLLIKWIVQWRRTCCLKLADLRFSSSSLHWRSSVSAVSHCSSSSERWWSSGALFMFTFSVCSCCLSSFTLLSLSLHLHIKQSVM